VHAYCSAEMKAGKQKTTSCSRSKAYMYSMNSYSTPFATTAPPESNE